MAAIFGRFSQNSEALLIEAQNIAGQLKRPVRTDIVLLAILSQNNTLAATLLKTGGIDQSKLVEFVTEKTSGELPRNDHTDSEMRNLLEDAIKIAGRFHFSTVEIEHLLYVIAKDDNLSGHRALLHTGVDPKLIISRLTEWLFSVAMISQQPQQEITENRNGERERIDIERYVTNITELAAKGLLDPVIGREQEIDQIIHILLRRRKNNPMLLGEPGVGKTAIVDGLAQHIVKRKVPNALVNKRILTLDLSLVVAGTMYRGQFEERLKGIMQEIQQLGNCILFVDEIHTLSGTGSAEGGFDAANILKPSLARGDITVIGATTHEEYRKHILKDKALDRRFQTISIDEPDHKSTIAMLRGLKKDLERHHAVAITEEAVKSAVDLSERYIHDRYLPDKAIDILDQACTLHAEPYKEDAELQRLQQEIALVSAQKSESALMGEYDTAKSLMDKENQLMQQLQNLESKKSLSETKPVTTEHIVAVISRRTGIPVHEIQQSLEPMHLSAVKDALSSHILGQDEAIKRISQVLMRSQLGLQPKKKPLGSFLLVGPTGVGKTETARILAREVYKDANALIKIDMSEFMERHNVSNLIGAPAGYVGFDQGGSLTEKVRRRPYSIILFDEVEKAHPDVFHILLQILEDGSITDNTGTAISFEHAFIIMTSNIGMESFNQVARIGFNHEDDEKKAADKEREELEEHIRSEIEDFFRPELLGRLSGIVFYNPLGKDTVKKLFERKLKDLKTALKRKDIILKTSPKLVNWLTERYEPEAGARSIDRTFLNHLEPAVIEAILNNTTARQFAADVKDNAVSVSPIESDPKP